MARGPTSSTTLLRPDGARWAEFRRYLWRSQSARGPVACFACGCPVAGPGQGEIEHRISASRRPDLAWTEYWRGERFLVWVHGSDYSARGGPNKRCPVHDIACNMVIGSNAARRDELGRSLPLTPEELEAAVARAQGRPRSTAGKDRRRRPARTISENPTNAPARPKPDVLAGRPWLCWALRGLPPGSAGAPGRG